MLKKHKIDFDLVVIGSGAGGSTAAILAAKAGLKVAIVEANEFGGDAPNYSDIPMSALLHTSHLYDQARRGQQFGISSSNLHFNLPTMMNWKNSVIKHTGANNRQFYEEAGVKTIKGSAHFLSSHEISVNKKNITSKKYLIASGAVPIRPDIKNLENVKHLTPRSLLDIHHPVKSIFIVGGGSTGVEIAQFFAELGTKVLIADIASRLLPRDDEEVGQVIGQALDKNHGIKVLTSSRVVAIKRDSIHKEVTFLRGGQEKFVKVDEVLIATGKTPAVDLGLENAGVEYTKNGITVNDNLQTSAKHIFAAGDVIGGNSSTSKAMHDSQVAANNIISRKKITADYNVIPKITSTYPAIASVGLKEDDAIKRDLKFSKSIIPLSHIARSNTSNFKDGFVKLIVDRKNGVILGGTVVSPEADSVINELSLAIRYNLTTYDLANLPHAFLSWSEAVKLASQKIK
jgi:Pyruvate/2-oxoglutarate dehydrogenase complex, dihydrolipoamide dehydrogenase (E3) component, and related enzymes